MNNHMSFGCYKHQVELNNNMKLDNLKEKNKRNLEEKSENISKLVNNSIN